MQTEKRSGSAALCRGARRWRSCERLVIVIVLDEAGVLLLSLRWLVNILGPGVIIKDAELIFVGSTLQRFYCTALRSVVFMLKA